MRHPFTLADYGEFVLAWADAWPGLLCGAPSRDALERRMPLAIAEYRHWLESNGEEGPLGDAWQVVASAPSYDADTTGGDPCYASDLQPLSAPDFERFLRHARLAQLELARAADLPDLLLDWQPEGLVVEDADPWAPDPRTIRGILTHALQLEVFYREGLRDGPAAGIFEPVEPTADELGRTLDALRRAATAGLDRVWHPVRPHPARPQPVVPGDWTIRKVLRRLISHDRDHAAEILQRRTWLLLGVPKQGD